MDGGGASSGGDGSDSLRCDSFMGVLLLLFPAAAGVPSIPGTRSCLVGWLACDC